MPATSRAPSPAVVSAGDVDVDGLVGHRGDEGSAQKQMLGDTVDADIGFLDGQMPDRDQYRVLNSDEADPGCVTGADWARAGSG